MRNAGWVRCAWVGATAATVLVFDGTYDVLQSLLTRPIDGNATTILIIYPDAMTRALGVALGFALSTVLCARWRHTRGRLGSRTAFLLGGFVSVGMVVRYFDFTRHLESNLAVQWWLLGVAGLIVLSIGVSRFLRGKQGNQAVFREIAR